MSVWREGLFTGHTAKQCKRVFYEPKFSKSKSQTGEKLGVAAGFTKTIHLNHLFSLCNRIKCCDIFFFFWGVWLICMVRSPVKWTPAWTFSPPIPSPPHRGTSLKYTQHMCFEKAAAMWEWQRVGEAEGGESLLLKKKKKNDITIFYLLD